MQPAATLAQPHAIPGSRDRRRALIKEARERQRRRRRWLVLAAVATATAIIAGHGISTRLTADGPSAAPAAALANPCALLTNADVAKVFGAKVAYRTPKPEQRACSWSGWPYAHQYGQKVVTLDVAPVTRAEFERAFSTWIVFDGSSTSRRTAQSTRIHGVGEAAFAQIFAGVDLEVYYHGLVISISTTLLSAPLAAEKQLAAAAIARLEQLRSETSPT